MREYDSIRAEQQGPITTLTAALKRSIKTVTGCIFYHTNKNITNEKNYRISDSWYLLQRAVEATRRRGGGAVVPAV